MGYFIKREDGMLLRAFTIKTHHASECKAELRMHGSEPMAIAWYESEGNWRILVAGAEAVRFSNER